ncbi:MAG TPA: YozQ family protein [Chondromyces sp.]|nr:YozQ family protein [Chondromyces sp.]
MTNKRKEVNSTELAGRHFEMEDYKRNDELSQGLAITHEQATDSWTEGTIDGVMENVAGKDIPLDHEE